MAEDIVGPHGALAQANARFAECANALAAEVTHTDRVACERDAAIAAGEKLAEALQSVLNWLPDTPSHAIDIANEALAAWEADRG